MAETPQTACEPKGLTNERQPTMVVLILSDCVVALFITAVPFSGTNHSAFDWFVPKTGLRY